MLSLFLWPLAYEATSDWWNGDVNCCWLVFIAVLIAVDKLLCPLGPLPIYSSWAKIRKYIKNHNWLIPR